MFERLRRCEALRANRLSQIGILVASAAVLVAGRPAMAQFSSDFESPLYAGSAAGTIITGQDGFYIPVVDSYDGLVYTYTGNALGMPVNPSGGGDQFAGVTGGVADPVAFARAQRDLTYGGGTGVWTVSYDIATTYLGVLPSDNNIGSFSTQAFPGDATYIALVTWVDIETAENWNVGYVWFDNADLQITEVIDDPGFQNLETEHWYRWSTTFNLDTNQILQVSITDLTTNITSTVSPVGRYLDGGATGDAPPPTGFRLFGGTGVVGAEGNTLAFDNVDIELRPDPAVGSCCLADDSCLVLSETDCLAANGSYSGDGTGCTVVTCVDIPPACGKGSGGCDNANGSPGCDDVECCVQVCDVDPICCLLDWDQTCVDIAINLGCVVAPCNEPGDVEGVMVPASEDFDSYDDGFALTGVNGWTGWDDAAGAVANVSSVQSRSAPHSIEIDAGDDPVQQYLGAFCEDQWTYVAWQYIPSEMTGLTYFIMLNTYSNGGTKNWSVQVNYSVTNGFVVDDGSGNQLPVITDQWVELRLEIDLLADTQTFFYNGVLLYTGVWSEYISADGSGKRVIDTVDLFASGATPVYYDDINLDVAGDGEPCPWDLDNGGFVGAGDLLLLLADWGNPYGASELLDLLAAWGACP